jgi:hypothetical protein
MAVNMEQIQQQLAALVAENQNLQQQLAAVQMEQMRQQQAYEVNAAITPELVQRLTALPEHIATAMNAGRTRALVDTRGIGQPPKLRDPPGDNGEFVVWCRKMENYAAAVFEDARTILPWCAEQTETVTVAGLVIEFEDVEEAKVRELNSQLFTALMSLTEGESFTLVTGSGSGEGLNAWRRLHKRWDPSTAGRAGGLLREILTPPDGRAKIADLQATIETLEDKMRRYCSRKDQNGARHTLGDDIRRAALEAVLPQDVEKHIQLNRARLSTYDAMRDEVMSYAEARGVSVDRKSTKTKNPDDMDIGSYQKGKKGKGKGKGDGKKGGKGSADKSTIVCWECGKKGHYGRDCYAKTKKGDAGTAAGTKTNSSKGKGSKSKAGGQAAAGALALEDAPAPAQVDAGTFDLGSYAAAASMNAAPANWICVNVDSGAGATVWPENSRYGEEKPATRRLTCRTATGEFVESGNQLVVTGTDAWGRRLKLSGHKAAVHKPLASAGEITSRGHDVIMTKNGGYILNAGSKVLKDVKKAFDKSIQKHGWDGIIELVVEKGVYNMYIDPDDMAGGEDARARELCAHDAVKNVSGGQRQGTSP